MGYDADWHGQLTITPALTWVEIKAAPKLRDLELTRREITEDTDAGQVTTVTGTMLIPLTSYGAYSGGRIEDEIKAYIAAFPNHEFTGAISADGPEGNHWRYIVQGREVAYQEPSIAWPGEEQHPVEPAPVDRLVLRDLLAEQLGRVVRAAPGLDLDVEHDRRFIATALAGAVGTFLDGSAS